MEMKVDSQLIRSRREQRAWSQEHLAQVADLGHRTVQRIENTGTASFESVMALATALDVSTAELNSPELDKPVVNSPEPNQESSAHSPNPRQEAPSIKIELPIRLLLAIASGIAVPLLIAFSPPGSSLFRGFGDVELLLNLFCGALFAVTVLCPYLQRGDKLLRSSLCLIAAGGVSFHCAYGAAMFLSDISEPLAFVGASVVGMAILLLAVRYVAALSLKRSYWLPILGASLIGGAAIYTGLALVSDFEFARLATVLGFCVWHILLSLLFYFGRPVDEAGNRPGSVLLDFLVWATQKSDTAATRLTRFKVRFTTVTRVKFQPAYH